ncbi:MAG: DUF3489 domain-containing protein [Bauldia sp.]|nr:DUF3489 domain-containing protein [Bauldia sp.]
MVSTSKNRAGGGPHRAKKPAGVERKRRDGAARPNKLDLMVKMLRRPKGVSLTELTAATGWQPHSVRGALAGSLKKKGHAVVSDKTSGERRYRIDRA